MSESRAVYRGERVDLVPREPTGFLAVGRDWPQALVDGAVSLKLAGYSYAQIAEALRCSEMHVYNICHESRNEAGVSAAELAHQLAKSRLAQAHEQAAKKLAERGIEPEIKAVDANRLIFAADRSTQSFLDLTEGRRGAKSQKSGGWTIKMVDQGQAKIEPIDTDQS